MRRHVASSRSHLFVCFIALQLGSSRVRFAAVADQLGKVNFPTSCRKMDIKLKPRLQITGTIHMVLSSYCLGVLNRRNMAGLFLFWNAFQTPSARKLNLMQKSAHRMGDEGEGISPRDQNSLLLFQDQ